jgi:hypothetical protein
MNITLLMKIEVPRSQIIISSNLINRVVGKPSQVRTTSDGMHMAIGVGMIGMIRFEEGCCLHAVNGCLNNPSDKNEKKRPNKPIIWHTHDNASRFFVLSRPSSTVVRPTIWKQSY